jgi:hypothetical protein
MSIDFFFKSINIKNRSKHIFIVTVLDSQDAGVIKPTMVVNMCYWYTQSTI